MPKYDVIIAVGTGISEKGELNPSGFANADKAIELYQKGLVARIIFSGKWSYRFDYHPVKTEAQAMAEYATSKDIPKKDILIEDKSMHTVGNFCEVKKHFLIPNHWHNVILVTSEPHSKRAQYNLKKVLGPNYNFKAYTADYGYTKVYLKDFYLREEEKLAEAKALLGNIPDGDHKAIEKRANEAMKLYNAGETIKNIISPGHIRQAQCKLREGSERKTGKK